MNLEKIGQLLMSAQQLAKSGRLAEAERQVNEVLAGVPGEVNAANLKGMLRLRQGDAAGALPHLKLVAEAAPTMPAVWVGLGGAQRMTGDLVGAEGSYLKALKLSPNLAGALDGLGHVAYGRRDLVGAEKCLRQALLYQPRRGDTLTLLGGILCDTGREQEGVQCLNAAVQINPNHPQTRYNLAKGLQQAGEWERAEAAYRGVLAIAPEHFLSAQNLGNLLCETLRADEGLALQEKAAAGRPMDPTVTAVPLLTRQYMASTTAGGMKDAAVAWAERRAVNRGVARLASGATLTKVLLVSGDFNEHPVAHFLMPWVRHHDRATVELTALHLGATDEMTRRLSDAGLKIIQLSRGTGPTELAAVTAAINDTRADVVMDLAGHTRGVIPAAVAGSDVPVRLSMLGYPGSTGFASLTGYVSDGAVAEGADCDAEFAEPLLRLPVTAHCWSVPADAKRLDVVRDGPVRIGVVNNLAKVTPEFLGVVAEIAKKADGATLVFKSRGLGSDAAKRMLLAEMERLGVGAGRMELHSWIPAGERWAFMQGLDFTVDTFPYNGTTTTCEALWCGVPVLTVRGERYAGRVSAGLLKLAGLSDWVCGSKEEIVERAVGWVQKPEELRGLRARIHAKVDACAWRDEVGYAGQMDGFLQGLVGIQEG